MPDSRESPNDTVLRNWGSSAPGPPNGVPSIGLADLMIALVKQQAGVHSICDLGCGNGYLASRLGSHGYQVSGIDASERVLEVARKHYAGDHVTFHHGVFGQAMTGSAFEKAGQFDLGISSDVVEHLYQPSCLMTAASHLIRPGGILVIGTPYYGYMKNLAISLLGKWDQHHGVHWDGGHVKFFSVRTLKALIENAGFEVQSLHFHGRIPGFWRNMICVARKLDTSP